MEVEMCYVLADVNARAAQEEDLQNIIRGAGPCASSYTRVRIAHWRVHTGVCIPQRCAANARVHD
eukprot:1371759-Rhodomonas_salina.2